jgi:membrane-bound lytic murein transglycosylase A
VPLPQPAPVVDAVPVATPALTAPGGEAVVRARSRWIPVDWSELPGWESDATLEAWPALMRSCERPAADWQKACADARQAAPSSHAAARAWLQLNLQVFRVESPEGTAQGLATGYFEPLVEATRTPRGSFQFPLYQPPPDLASRKPWWSRQQVDTLPAAQAGLRGRELAYVADPLDVLVLQIQGSGRLSLVEADGSRKLVRAAFGGHNDQPYRSVGRWLVEQGELKAEQASWPAIKAWARIHPERLNEMLWSNPRMVFFREEPLPDPALGPRGGQGVPLTPGRSIAADAQSIPYGTPAWLDTTEPLSDTPLRRLVVVQDTGSAITGAVRADYFWGWGEQAEQSAGRMKQALRLWVLWPRR